MSTYWKAKSAFLALLFTVFTGIASAQQLAPPKYQLVDRMGVNAHSGQVIVDIPTLSIGGALGLSHRVSSSNSNFIQQNAGGAFTGISDKYFGSAIYTQVLASGMPYINEDIYSSQHPTDHFRDVGNGIWLMRVHDHEGSADFKVMYAGYARGYSSSTSGYTYESLGDKRNTLVIPTGQPGYLLWTKPDGTKTWFYRGTSNINARSKGYVEKVEYPNGFTLYFSRNTGNSVAYNSITTNTGYQLKYNYVSDATASYGIGSGNSWSENPPESNATWSSQNPYSVIGINTAIERCSSDSAVVCVSQADSCPTLTVAGQSCSILNNKWPTAKFSWPKGMPRAVFFGDTVYSVTDAQGGVTKVYLTAYDKYKDENGNPISGSYPVGQAFVPRITAVQTAGSSSKTVNYTYKNYRHYETADIRWPDGQADGTIMPGAYIYSIPGETALVRTASGINGSYLSYMEGIRQSIFPYAVEYPAADGLYTKKLHQYFGILMSLRSQSEIVTFQLDFRNFPYMVASADNPVARYFYDSRGNVNKITYSSTDQAAEYSVEADYPTDAECTNPKTCNQPKWTSDALGNKTYYTYHEPSGQIESITYPPNDHGISPQTRFGYEQYYATYINDAGAKVQAADPIWLKSYEKYCINSAYVNGACANNDQVVTRYAYNSDNLNLTSVAVSDPILLRTATTCYEYDNYGNRIGETKPKAGCN